MRMRGGGGSKSHRFCGRLLSIAPNLDRCFYLPIYDTPELEKKHTTCFKRHYPSSLRSDVRLAVQGCSPPGVKSGLECRCCCSRCTIYMRQFAIKVVHSLRLHYSPRTHGCQQSAFFLRHNLSKVPAVVVRPQPPPSPILSRCESTDIRFNTRRAMLLHSTAPKKRAIEALNILEVGFFKFS